MTKAGALDFVFLLGATRSTSRPVPSRSISQHGDRGAHRADVILPGAAYTEKSGLYVKRRRVQMAARAGFRRRCA